MKSYTAIVALALLLGSSHTRALEKTERSQARAVDVIDQSATLLSHEPVLRGLSCRSGSVGALPNLQRVKLGDTISYKNYSFQVGIIEVTKTLQNMKSGGKTIAQQGDVVCAVAASAKTLPYDDKCNALWVYIPKCRPIQ